MNQLCFLRGNSIDTSIPTKKHGNQSVKYFSRKKKSWLFLKKNVNQKEKSIKNVRQYEFTIGLQLLIICLTGRINKLYKLMNMTMGKEGQVGPLTDLSRQSWILQWANVKWLLSRVNFIFSIMAFSAFSVRSSEGQKTWQQGRRPTFSSQHDMTNVLPLLTSKAKWIS